MYQNNKDSFIQFLIIFFLFPCSLSAWNGLNTFEHLLTSNQKELFLNANLCEEDEDYRQVIYYLSAISSQFEENTDSKILNHLNLQLGNAYYRLSDYQLSLEYCLRVIENTGDDKVLKSKVLGKIANIYQQMGDVDISHDYKIKAIKLREEIDDQEGIANDLYDLGSLFFYQKIYDESLKYYKQAFEIAKKENFKTLFYRANAALGSTYEALGELDKSLVYNAKALHLAEQLNSQVGIAYALHNFGSNYASQNKHEKAIEYFQRSLAIKEKLNDNWGKAGDYLAMGKSFTEIGNFKEAQQALQASLDISKKAKSKIRIADSYKSLAEVFRKTNNVIAENESLHLYIATRDSMLNEAAIAELGGRKSAYEMQKKEKEILLLESQKSILEARNKLNNVYKIIGISVILLIGFGLAFVMRSYRRQKKNALELEAKSKEIQEKTEKIQIQNHLLEQSNEELKNFASVASHDLKEPLRMVSSFSGLLHRKYDNVLDDSGHEYVYFINDAIDRMGKLLDDLLQYSGINKTEHIPEVFNSGNVAASIKMQLTPRIQEKNGTVVIPFDKMPMLKGNKSQFGQLLQNLIANGLKFHNGKAPRVTIDCLEREKDYLFSVNDNGIGISEENQRKIFEMFTRLHSRKDFQGSGIGLSTCKKIVERHGGDIWVESEPGAGASFFFTILKQN